MFNIDTVPKMIAEGKYTTANRSVGDIKYVVIHDMEAPERSTTAEAVARYFRDSSVKASAHLNIDNDSIVRSVEDKDVAWAAPGANRTGLQLELAGYARQTRAEWLDAYSRAVLDNAAQVTAQYCKRYEIPVRRLTVAELQAGDKRGIIGHVDATNAFRRSTHTDPGANFPWDVFLTQVTDYYSQLGGKYKMLFYGKRGSPDFNAACAAVDMAKKGVATSSLDEAKAAVARGDEVVAVGGPAARDLGFPFVVGQIKSTGNKIAVVGTDGLHTMELLTTIAR